MTSCPEEDVLGAFLSGELDEALRVHVEAHLADCSRCASTVAAAASSSSLELEREREREIEPSEPGSTIDRYHVLGIAGRGAVGVVYAAYDPRLDRRIALKVLRRTGPELEERLHREARAMARVRSPHVVAVHDAGVADGQLYVAMELVEGQTLREWLAAGHRSVAEILAVFTPAAPGLPAAHASGIGHRDFKPDNVLVRPGGQVAVSDFGLALAGADSSLTETVHTVDNVHLTSTGMLVGTPAYMAPEQLVKGGTIDARSDVFAFCVTLFAALYGRHPFPTSSLRELRAAIREGRVTPTRDSAVPRRVREVVLAGLRPDPEDRPASMDKLLARLEPTRRRWVSLALAAAVVAGGVALAVVVRPEPIAAERPCQGAARKLAGIWDPERRASVARALAATGSPLAADVTRRVGQALDDYAARWVAGHTDACEATRVWGEQTEIVLERRMACLDERLVPLAALVRSIEHASPEQVASTVIAAHRLPDLDACTRPRTLTDPAPLASPAHGPLIRLAYATAAQAKVKGQLGDRAAAARNLEPALSIAEATGDRALEAEVRSLQGQLQFASDPVVAEASLHGAARAAQACGRADLAARGWMVLARIVGRQGRDDEATRWLAYAESAVERTQDDMLRADLLLARADAARSAQRRDQAIELCRGAVALLATKQASDELRIAEAEGALGTALLDDKRANEALVAFTRAAEIQTRALGPDHPYTLYSRARMGTAMRDAGRHEEALVMLSNLLAEEERIYGAKNLQIKQTLSAIALVNYDLGRYRQAAASFERSVSLTEQSAGATERGLIYPLGMLARSLAWLGEFDAADRHARRAVDIAQRSGVDVPFALKNQGAVMLRAGKCDEAVRVLERARVLFDDAKDPNVVDALDPLGACLRIVGKHRASEATFLRALTLHEQLHGPEHPFTTQPLVGLSETYHAMGDDRRAAPPAERAVNILVAAKQGGHHIAEARLRWASALWSHDRPAARAQARQALVDAASYPDHPVRAEIERWLARHP